MARSRTLRLWPLPALLALAVPGFDPPARASLVTFKAVNRSLPNGGLQPRAAAGISVCFYGNAIAERPTFAQDIQRFMRDWFPNAANIHFTGFQTCEPPQQRTCGTDSHPCKFYPGDLRIALEDTTANGAPVPLKIASSETDCDDLGDFASWASSPDHIDQSAFRACPYNVMMREDHTTNPPTRWTNETLHEIGHALGLSHEFVHEGFFNVGGPNGSLCTSSTTAPMGRTDPASITELTPQDIASVMHYVDSSCGIRGNFDNTGLSPLDRLGLHILYPEPDRIAEWVGTTVVKTGQPARLVSDWFVRGAIVSTVIGSISWSLDGSVRSTAVDFSVSFSAPGDHSGTVTYQDFLGRTYTAGFVIRALTPEDYNRIVMAPTTANASLL